MRLEENTIIYRFSAFLLLFFGIFVRQAYGANLYALLTVPQSTKIDSIEALFRAQKSPSVKLITAQWFRIYKEQMMSAPSEKTREIGRNVVAKGSDLELLEKVKASTSENNYVLIGLRDMFELMIEESPKELYLSPNVAESTFFFDRLGMAVRKGNPLLLTNIDRSVRLMRYHGFFEHWCSSVVQKLSLKSRRRSGLPEKKSFAEDDSDQLGLTIHMHTSTFYSFMLSVQVASFCVLCELISSKLRKPKAKSYRRSFRTRLFERQNPALRHNFLW